jgi:hypothetical protein
MTSERIRCRDDATVAAQMRAKKRSASAVIRWRAKK